MKSLISNAVTTYRATGALGLGKKAIGYATNWRQITGDLSWFMTSRLNRHGQVTVTLDDGRRMQLHPHDPGLSRELYIYGVHEPAATGLLSSIVSEGLTCVDVGANIGYYTLIEAQLVGRRGKIVAIEPEEANLSLLQRNVELNNAQNVLIAPRCALGSTDAVGSLYLGGTANWHSLVPPPGETLPHVSVPVRTLDALLTEMDLPYVDFIRMDIEGYEVEAVKGMQRTLEHCRPHLMIELHFDSASASAIRELLDSLKSLGYRVTYLLDRDQDWPWNRQQDVKEDLSIDELIAVAATYRVAMCFLQVASEDSSGI